jgi:hypothetical protein
MSNGDYTNPNVLENQYVSYAVMHAIFIMHNFQYGKRLDFRNM